MIRIPNSKVTYNVKTWTITEIRSGKGGLRKKYPGGVKAGADSAGGGGTGARAPPPPRQWLQAWVYTYYFIMR